MGRKRIRRKDILDEVFEEFLNLADSGGGADVARDFRSAVHEASAKVADALGFPVPQFAEDRGHVPPPGPQAPRNRARYADVGPSHYLVMQVVLRDGRPKVEWKTYKADDPDVKPEQFVDEYLADRTILGLLVFQGALLFRDMRQFPGTDPG